MQDFFERPVRTAGSRDTFNAGYMVALMNRLEGRERLAVANAAPSFFVRNGYPPTSEQLVTEVSRIISQLAG